MHYYARPLPFNSKSRFEAFRRQEELKLLFMGRCLSTKTVVSSNEILRSLVLSPEPQKIKLLLWFCDF